MGQEVRDSDSVPEEEKDRNRYYRDPTADWALGGWDKTCRKPVWTLDQNDFRRMAAARAKEAK